ncbi:MAG: HPr family phosphocarrier protein [Rhodospirillales bacterium]|jgi:phosphocarrier protein HPr
MNDASNIPDMPKNAAAAITQKVTISNMRGLHARAASKFVTVAGGFDADITVHREGTTVSGRSIMGLMMLAAGIGSEIELSAEGAEATEAIASLVSLVEAKFEED